MGADNEAMDAPRRVGVRECRANLPHLLRQARDGATFLITSHNEVIAVIRPPSVADHSSREPGALRGKIHLAADFDTLPPELLVAMER